MPEFVMENRNECFREESPFVAGFIEVLFFTECSPAYDSSVWFKKATQRAIEEGQSDGNLPGDVGYSDLEPESLLKIRKFCEDWQAKHAPLLERVFAETEYTQEQCGRDFFYEHVGHGVGFSDREELKFNDSDNEEYERLTAIMIANRDNNEVWGKALSERNAIEKQGFAALLSEAAGHGEVIPYYERKRGGNVIHVSLY